MLILSGAPELGDYVQKEEQLARLLRPVGFDPIHPSKDMDEMNRLAAIYADRAGLCFDALSSTDFFPRLAYAYACAGRWGLVIELIIETFVQYQVSQATRVSISHFVEAFAKATGQPPGYSPFTIDDYRESFDPDKLLDLVSRSS